jgi:hypothetical protein
MDERVVYPGQADLEVALGTARARYMDSQQAVKSRPPPEPLNPPTPQEPPPQPPKQPGYEPLEPPGAGKKWIYRLGVGVLTMAILGSGWWWKNQQDQRLHQAQDQPANQPASQALAVDQARSQKEAEKKRADEAVVKRMAEVAVDISPLVNAEEKHIVVQKKHSLDKEIKCETLAEHGSDCNSCYNKYIGIGKFSEISLSYTNNSKNYIVFYKNDTFRGINISWQLLQNSVDFIIYPSGELEFSNQKNNGILEFTAINNLKSSQKGEYFYINPNSVNQLIMRSKFNTGIGLKSVHGDIERDRPLLKIAYDTSGYEMSGEPPDLKFSTGKPELYRSCQFYYISH